MTKPIILIHNTETNEVIEREMTAAEFKIYQANQEAQLLAKTQADAAKAKAEADKAALLARLGLTEDELKTILG